MLGPSPSLQLAPLLGEVGEEVGLRDVTFVIHTQPRQSPWMPKGTPRVWVGVISKLRAAEILTGWGSQYEVIVAPPDLAQYFFAKALV